MQLSLATNLLSDNNNLQILILQPPTPKCQDSRPEQPNLLYVKLGIKPKAFCIIAISINRSTVPIPLKGW